MNLCSTARNTSGCRSPRTRPAPNLLCSWPRLASGCLGFAFYGCRSSSFRWGRYMVVTFSIGVTASYMIPKRLIRLVDELEHLDCVVRLIFIGVEQQRLFPIRLLRGSGVTKEGYFRIITFLISSADAFLSTPSTS